MKMSAGVEWGTHICLLPPQADDRLVGRRPLADHFGLPEAYLAKQLKKLVAAGVLEAVPGPAGGYRLAAEPGRITLLDIVEAIEGAEPSFTCTEIRQQGTGAASPDDCLRDCIVKTSMLNADQAWRDTLRNQTVHDLAIKLPKAVTQRYRNTTLR